MTFWNFLKQTLFTHNLCYLYPFNRVSSDPAGVMENVYFPGFWCTIMVLLLVQVDPLGVTHNSKCSHQLKIYGLELSHGVSNINIKCCIIITSSNCWLIFCGHLDNSPDIIFLASNFATGHAVIPSIFAHYDTFPLVEWLSSQSELGFSIDFRELSVRVRPSQWVNIYLNSYGWNSCLSTWIQKNKKCSVRDINKAMSKKSCSRISSVGRLRGWCSRGLNVTSE